MILLPFLSTKVLSYSLQLSHEGKAGRSHIFATKYEHVQVSLQALTFGQLVCLQQLLHTWIISSPELADFLLQSHTWPFAVGPWFNPVLQASQFVMIFSQISLFQAFDSTSPTKKSVIPHGEFSQFFHGNSCHLGRACWQGVRNWDGYCSDIEKHLGL